MNLTNALDIFSDNYEDIKKSCLENIEDILLNTPKPANTGDEMLDWVRLEVWKLKIEDKTKGYRLTYKRIVSRQQSAYSRKTACITDEMIERAREYPIRELFTELTGNELRHGMARCPFHEDHTASLSVGKFNRYKCFGCDEKGDSISLYMKLNNGNFINAVKALQ